MLCRKKRSPAAKRFRKRLAVILAVIVLLVWYFEYAVREQLEDVIIRDMYTLTQRCVSRAVDDLMAEDPDIGSRLTVLRDNGSGGVSAITTDPAYINAVKTFVTERAQQYIDEEARGGGVSANLGNFTGLVFLTDAGPEIAFHVESAQTVSCEFNSTFEGAGLNQTVHHSSMTVYADVLVYNPFRIRKTVSTESTFEIAQTVIVGDVPSYSTSVGCQ